jgi:hypothetical protein
MQDSATDTIQDSALAEQPDAGTSVPDVVDFSVPVLCCYLNASSRIQVVRLSHLSEGDWEHILFPGQRFMFEAPPETMLQVYKSPVLSATSPEYIRCQTLQVQSD